MRRLLSLLVGTLVLLAQPASAAWLQASSDHFIIYADMSPQQLHAFATRLERFDKGLRTLLLDDVALDDGLRSNRLRIYVVPTADAVRQLCGKCPSVMGFYVPRAGGSVVFTPRRSGNGSRFDLDAQTVLFHEYAHHFMYSNLNAANPPWYVEGFAEFASTARLLDDGGVGFGIPAMHRAYGLLRIKPMPAEELFDAAVSRSSSPGTIEAFYSRGWLLTHYLTFNVERRGQLSAYIKALNQGTPSLTAARAAFGDLKALDRELERYLRRPRLSYLALSGEKLRIGSIDIRPLSAGAAAMMPVHMRSTRGVSPEQAAALLPEARRIAASYPDDPVVQAQLAEAEYDAGHDDRAEQAADRALRADAANRHALIYKGLVRMRRAVTAESKDPNVWKDVRSWFVKANKTDPNAVEPLIHFYDSYQAAGLPPTPNAVTGLHRAIVLAPEDRGVRLRGSLQALTDKDLKLARILLTPLAFDPHGGPLRDRAATAMALIDAGKLEEATETLKDKDEDVAQLR